MAGGRLLPSLSVMGNQGEAVGSGLLYLFWIYPLFLGGCVIEHAVDCLKGEEHAEKVLLS